jgi:hypothetical protein
MVQFGYYAIAGVTKDETNTPAQKYVAVFERAGTTMPLIDAVLSDAVTGEYSITVTNDTTEHFVVCFDSTDDPLVDGGSGENALIFDRVKGVYTEP